MGDTIAKIPALFVKASFKTNMATTNETLQLRSIRSGDVKAFKVLFEDKYPGLVKLSYQYVADEAVAKDMVQQVFIRFWEKKESIFIADTINGYLRKMVTNESLAYLRTKNRRIELIQPIQSQTQSFSNDTETVVLTNELQRQINEAVENLPEKCGVVFKMSRYESMTYQQIAQELNISTKTVENQIGTALKKLRYALKKYLYSIFF
jgi:RNA polymerase sigma-70 factor (ECF subfamily)